MDGKSDDEEKEAKLDVEFRRILKIIKIYVPCIMNVDYLTSYRVWLEKLSEADITDKHDRNQYLLELCRQIQDGILENPFKQRPRPGQLPPLKRNTSVTREQLLLQQQQQEQLLQIQQQQIQHLQKQQLQQQMLEQQLQQQKLQQRQQNQEQQQLQQLQQNQEYQQLQQQKLQQRQQHQEQQQLQQQKLQLQQNQEHQQFQQQTLQQNQEQQQVQQLQQNQEQQQLRHYLGEAIAVKQESIQQTTSKDRNHSNKPSNLRQKVQNYQEDDDQHNYMKSKSLHTEIDPQKIQNNAQTLNLMVLKNPPVAIPPNTSPKKRNQNTVLKEIQKHVRKFKRQNNVFTEIASQFPEPTEQQEMLSNNVNKRQYEEIHQRFLTPLNTGCVLENQEQNKCYQQQEPQSPSIFLKHQENSYPATQELFKNSPKQQKATEMSLRMHEEEEESSWYDISEASRTATASRMESGDSANSLLHRQSPGLAYSNNSISPSKIHEVCENKVKDLISIVTELKKQNSSLNAKAESVIQSLSEEISLLKSKEQPLKEIKNKNASVQWNYIVKDLKKTLRSAQEEIITLQNEIIALKDKLEEFSDQKQQDNLTIRQRLAEMYDKEIEMLKQNYVRHIVDIENKFTQILMEKEVIFNKKLNDLKEQYDKKISDITKGISEISEEQGIKNSEKCIRKPSVTKKTYISRHVPEKELPEKSVPIDKKPWRKRLVIGRFTDNF